MNRAQRRQAARRAAREGAAQMELAAERGEKPLGFFTEQGQYDDPASFAELPEKIPGKHRWIATAAYVMDDAAVVNEQRFQAGASTTKTVLDAERRFQFGIGCWDCEQPFPLITPADPCPAEAAP